MSLEGATIWVPNWEKWNPRGKERKKFHAHWFRMEDSIFSDPQFADFGPSEFMVLFYVLATTCQKQGEPWDLKISFGSKQCRVKNSVFVDGIRKLLELNVVRLSSHVRTNNSTSSCIQDRTGQDTTQQDTTGQNSENGPPSDDGDDPPLHPLAILWNSLAEGQPSPQVRAMGKRQKAAEARWAERPVPEYWEDVIKRAVLASHFCRGVNDRGWVADFEWLVRPDTHLKIMEGKYDNRGSPVRRKTNAELVSDANRELYEKVERGEA